MLRRRGPKAQASDRLSSVRMFSRSFCLSVSGAVAPSALATSHHWKTAANLSRESDRSKDPTLKPSQAPSGGLPVRHSKAKNGSYPKRVMSEDRNERHPHRF